MVQYNVSKLLGSDIVNESENITMLGQNSNDEELGASLHNLKTQSFLCCCWYILEKIACFIYYTKHGIWLEIRILI